MTSMKPNGFLTWAKVTNHENNVSVSVHGEKSYMKSPLLDTLEQQNNKHKTRSKVVFSILALLAITACLALARSQSTSGWFKLNGHMQNEEPDTGPDFLETSKGAVASDDSRCSEVGVSMLRLGGHAVDAAIATVVCAGVVNPSESSIGGGSFMIVREASNGKAVAFNMRETAPGAAHKDMYADNPQAQFEGPLAMAVPGELKGLFEAWMMYGRVPWKTLLQPAIRYARYGFEVFPYLARYAAEFEDKILADPGLRQVFAPNGKVLKKGETCYMKKLADTLDAVALNGPNVLYNGVIGQRLVKDVRAAGGILTMEDLKTYKVNVTNALEVDFMGFKLLGMHPPSSGTVGLAMVSNILKNYGDIAAELDGPLGLHRLTEALKHLLATRMNLGDPAFDDLSEIITKMTSSSFGTEIWKRIDDTTTFPAEYYRSRWSQVEDHGTSHQSIVDAERNAVSITSSINDHFGAMFISPSTGILINNQMGDFSIPTEDHPDHLPPAVTNLIEPGKRPLSSMSPLVVEEDGNFAVAIGSTGGRNIAAAVAQTLLNHFVFGKDPVASVHIPRVYPKLAEQDLDYEDMIVYSGEHIVLPEETIDFLAQRHHNMTVIGFPAFCHLIVKNFGVCDLGRKVGGVNCSTVTAVSDIRKGAKPAHE